MKRYVTINLLECQDDVPDAELEHDDRHDPGQGEAGGQYQGRPADEQHRLASVRVKKPHVHPYLPNRPFTRSITLDLRFGGVGIGGGVQCALAFPMVKIPLQRGQR